MHHLSNLLFFGIPLLYYYINLNSSIIFCLSYGDIYLSFDISLFVYLIATDHLVAFYLFFFLILVILSAILSPIRSSVAMAVFAIAFLLAIFNASVAAF